MAITRISQSSVKEGLEKYTSFYGGLSGALFGQYESIATVTVGSGGASSIEFTSIPGTYQHLQVRGIGRNSASVYIANIKIQVNGDTNDSGYPRHLLYGDGAAAGAAGSAGDANGMYFQYTTGANSTSSVFSANIIDFLDYASTSKYKTMRCFGGLDNNGQGAPPNFNAGYVYVSSGLWQSTSAITSIKFVGNFVQHSTLALYGIKAP